VDSSDGRQLKLAINVSLAVRMPAFAEGVIMAERAGVDRTRSVSVMTQSPILSSRTAERRQE
jgi:3-hydroxyisobutyrate dehydrogenase-like beta-hydroxyacid dehydrogenase